MSSPFTFFRRNQHVTMVGVVILSMIAFTIGDMFSGDGPHYVLLGIMIGGIICAFAGVSSGRWVQYGIAGTILGGLSGWFLPEVISPAGSVYRTSTLGTFDDKRIGDLMLRRSIANVFLQQAFEKSFGAGMGQFAPQFQFYSNNVEDDLTFGELMRAEADDLGIVVTNAMVSDYINDKTDKKLTKAAFAEIRTNLSLRGTVVSETELFDSFRDEIKAQMAYEHLNPHFAAVPQGPEVYFELFKRTKVSQRLNTVRLSVDDFTSNVPDPSDAEVASLFNDGRLKFPNMDEPGSPGFRQPPKAKLAYLELSYKSVEQTVDAPGDADVEAYYNENKDRLYRKPVESTEEPKAEEPKAEEPKAEEPKAEEPKAEEPKAEEPKAEEPKAEEPKAEEPKAEEPKAEEPKAEEPKAEEPKAEEPKAEEPKAEEPGDQCLPFEAAQDEQTPAAPAESGSTDPSQPQEPAAAEEKDTAPTVAAESSQNAAEPGETPATPAQDDKPATEEQTTAEETPATEAAVEDSTKPEFEIPKIEYQPLDEDLKGEIRDRLLDERVRKSIDEKMTAVMQELKTLERERTKARKQIVDANRGISDQDLYEKMRDQSKQMLDGMKSIGEKYGCSFVETPLVSFLELNEGEAFPVGASTEPSANPFMQSGPSVAQQVFGAFPKQVFDDTNLFIRRQSVKNAFDLDGGETHFAWWITEFSDTHVPKLDDPGIRDQVVLAWKRAKARELAVKRAEELARMIRENLAKPEGERKDMATTVEGQTILGDAESPALTVRQTQTFFWMEQSVTPQMNFMQQRPTLRQSEVRFADEAGGSIRSTGFSVPGDRFMKTVFEQIDNESAGVASTDDLMTYFVVQPVERSADDEVLRQQFLTEGKQFGFQNGAVAQMLNSVASNPAAIAWENSVWNKYGIDRTSLPEE